MPARKRVGTATVVSAAVALLASAPAARAQFDPVPAAACAVAETANFRVEAPDAHSAQLVADRAEQHRKALALAWLGKELPAWEKPCPVKVFVTLGPPGGRSGFTFAGTEKAPAVGGMTMEVAGPLDAIVGGVLPHEVMHCVVTTHFGRPVPRWADEGLAILAESDDVQARTAAHFRDFRARGRTMRVKALLELTDYPEDRFAVYLEGFSVAGFLVGRKQGRAGLVKFLSVGMADGWDTAAKAVYGYPSVAALEEAWCEWLDKGR
jgi:hypothetical protein